MEPGCMEQYKKENPNALTEEDFRKLEQEIEHPKEKTISDEYFDFKLWQRGYPSRQEIFADYVDKTLQIDKSCSILEVGGGRIGRVSRILAGRGYQMTCMDPRLELSDKGSLQLIKDTFDYRTNSLADYDWVIAQEPCDATEHIVRACVEQNVPFFMTLCGVPHRLISGEMPEDVWKWYLYLQKINTEKTKWSILDFYPIARVAAIQSR